MIGDTCLSPAALTLVSGVVGALASVIIALYRANIARMEREVERLEKLVLAGNQGWADANQTARRARSEARS